MRRENSFQAPRGMPDFLPEESARLRCIEENARMVMESAGYCELRLPLAESAGLFQRAIGSYTDVVEKEMYSIVRSSDIAPDTDPTAAQESSAEREVLHLRPEGTAGCLRAAIQHGLLRGAVQRLWYSGEMFRYERPQKGRRRQFRQIGAELLGVGDALADAELISMGARLWRRLGISAEVSLEINSLGSAAERAAYKEVLADWLAARAEMLDADSRNRLHSNPLRILDSKHPGTRELLRAVPPMEDFLGAESKAHFAELQQVLDSMGIDWQLNPCLVRGLDYYCHTVFEWLGSGLGAQNAVAAGGRYDGLLSVLGGPELPAAGFAIGIERLALSPALQIADTGMVPDACFVVAGGASPVQAFVQAEWLREQVPGVRLLGPFSGRLTAQLRKADKSGSPLALICGAEESEAQELGVRDLRSGDGDRQRREKVEQVVKILKGIVAHRRVL